MRIGFLGAGRIGSFHAATLAAMDGVSDLVIGDADGTRATMLAQAIGARAVATVDDVFAARPDAMVIATATASHAHLITRAARAGLPTYCEKPIALDLAGTIGALREAEAAGTLLQLGFQRRFDAGYLAARQAVQQGALGRLHTIRAITSDPTPPPPEFLPLSGGLIRDCLVHDFDAVRWLTGREVTEVFATGSACGAEFFRTAGDVDTAAALLTLDDGTLVTATATRYNGAGYDVRMELSGERDQLVVGLGDRTPFSSVEPTGAPAPQHPWTGFLDRFDAAYRAELAAFVQAARGEAPNPCSGQEALNALLVAEACELSRHEHRPVRLTEIQQRMPDVS
ncbi:Gfo/Idh/MocA family protein [Streptomyces zagrosensis]|uniref:Myo-inositol 2-dehydrogenase/D-chiro-inositol 1-dehydrogenase n=1 Tax=Streptomyces zagrosensis TaxID=1042984 RepID=A0A7W9Q7K6_9ACTN|nr:Gfo/Idh/MocA family oxidoreductase [Streptomyces zagrosensis]MBB5935075.1 myo-inositol 2-dehydrogenase/D-chiro-inositol 1-dehydrogenase [Streptomyces zagrosensis]